MTDPLRIEIGLNAAIVAIDEGNPAILRATSQSSPSLDALPYGRFDPLEHRTMEEGLRGLAEEQTGLRPGYVEQLYTFGDRGRAPIAGDESPHVVSVGYLALTRKQAEEAENSSQWRSWYEYFPWEDWRNGRPSLLDEAIIPAMRTWSANGQKSGVSHSLDPQSRVRIAFGLDGANWEDELVLDRYELLYSAGLISEAVADGRIKETVHPNPPGHSMVHDHRRILATAIARLRGKLKYRPVIFELMPDTFTLFDLQRTVESIFGRSVHKQNFRRLVENAQLVEPTGAHQQSTGGRPAALFRFRTDILKERPAPGLKVGRG
ncbi:MAG: NAD regulator [Rhizobiaceae bacterium]|nr:NAD regulator [Rhizobiaceae bacterium]